MKEYLTKRGIQVSDQGRGKRKAELVELAQKAFKMKLPKIDEGDEDCAKIVEQELERRQTGDVFHDLSLSRTGHMIFLACLNSLSFADLYTYLIGSEEEYTAEKLKSFKSLQGYKLFAE